MIKELDPLDEFDDPFADEEVAVIVGSLAVEGGAEKVALQIAELLDCPIYTALYDPQHYSKEFNERAKGRVSVLEKESQNDEDFDGDAFRVESAYQTLTSVDSLEDIKIEHIAADGLVAADIQGAILGYLSGKPYITYTHHADKVVNDYFWDLFSEKEKVIDKLKFIHRRSKSVRDCRSAAKKANHLMCNSTRTRDATHDRWGVETDKTSIVYPPVETEYFTDGEGADPLDGNDYFLSVQRLEPYKNVHTLVEAAKKAEKHLVFVGNGTLEEYVRSEAQYSKYIHAFGYVDKEQLRELYRGAVATLQGTAKEDFGMVAVESMACGTPCILPASGGFLETVGEEYRPDDNLPDTHRTERGVLLGPDDFTVKGFAGVMQFALSSQDTFDKAAMREEAEKYSVKRFADEVHEAVNEHL